MTSDAAEPSSPKVGAQSVATQRTAGGEAASEATTFGIKAKLFLALCALAALTAVASAVAWSVFVHIDRSVTQVTEKSVPKMVDALRLAEKSAEIAATAPAIMASADEQERAREKVRLEERVGDLVFLIAELESAGVAPARIDELTQIEEQIGAELETLSSAVERRLRFKEQREAKVAGLGTAHSQFLDILEPLVDDAVFDLVITSETVTEESTEAITALVESGVGTINRLLTINAEGNLAAGLLAEAAHISDPALIQPIRERFLAAATAVERNLEQLSDGPETAKLRELSADLLDLGAGSESIFELRARELRAMAEARTSLQAKREDMTVALKTVHEDFLDALTPMVDDATFDLVLESETVTEESTEAITALVESGVGTINRLLTINAEGNLAAGLLAEAAHISDPALIQPIRERFLAAATAVERNLEQLSDGPETAKLRELSAGLLDLGTGSGSIFELRARELRAMAEARTSLQAKREDMTAALKTAHQGFLDALTPMVDDATFDLVLESETVTEESTEAITALVEGGVNTLQVLLMIRAEGNLAGGLLNAAASVPDASMLQPLRERFIASQEHINRMLAQVPAPVRGEVLLTATTGLLDLGQADDNIFALRRKELDQIAAAEASLVKSRSLVVQLGEEVAELVTRAQNESDATATRSAAAIERGKLFMMILTAASVVGAALVMFYYVGPRIIRPLERITTTMSELAAGDTSVDIPGRDRRDELGRMAQALGVFRDTAIEVQKSNLREIQETRRRLTDAIETISEGFSLYDRDDRLVVCNSMYRTILYPGMADDIVLGMTFETIIRRAAERGYVKDAEGRLEEWVEERLASHREPGDAHIQQRGDGRWIMVSERKTEDGGTVAVYSDITELKQREEELAEKSGALEQLSNQLAKYLSPQVYESIFAGRQEVKLTSRRKKLTVFFSDIAGFTETADKLESEELTQLLNHYITEMSKIALEYGATIDKYVGDAIVIFFGDPETRGVKEDAIACVEMAIAMRKRMSELESVWRESGIEQPLRVRMGINTGYCTVGNFGSEDRMDYTIIGGGVNLASRLESAATPGEILASYETYAHIKDRIHCVEHGQISVKGIAYPVATYQVIDSYENLGRDRDRICADRPNLKVDLDLEAMSPEERKEAAEFLRRALDRMTEMEKQGKPEPLSSNTVDYTEQT